MRLDSYKAFSSSYKRERYQRPLSLSVYTHTHTHTHTHSRMEEEGERERERERETEKRPCEDTVRRFFLPDRSIGTSLVAQWLRLRHPTQRVWGSIRG